MNKLSSETIRKALETLDKLLKDALDLVVGGGGAMVAAYGEKESTADLDAVPIRTKMTTDEFRKLVHQVAEALDLPKDWLNSYFVSFTHVLPADYADRTKEMFKGKHLHCVALGPEDLLLMKLMAGRQKDDRHIRQLLRRTGLNHRVVENRLEELKDKAITGAREALDRFDDYRSDLGIG